MTKIQEKIKSLPKKSGVYLYKNASGEVLYVGKAKDLKKRVKSYFVKKTNLEPRTQLMLSKAVDIEYIVVSSEIESLILENNLIKQFQPRFNVRMRDDKNYQFIKVDYETEIPQIYPVRKIEHRNSGKGTKKQKKLAKYFGPYTSASSVKQTIKLIKQIFHLCRNKKVTSRPCFAYHIDRCPGVCTGETSLTEYKKHITHIEDFLKNKQRGLIATLTTRMRHASKHNEFEKAARLRDQIRALTALWERQKIVSTKHEDQDFLGLYKTTRDATIAVLVIRDGKLIHQSNLSFSHNDASAEEIIERFIVQYYTDSSSIPREIYTLYTLDNTTLIERVLAKEKKQKVQIKTPHRGKKKNLVKLAEENAKYLHEQERASFERKKDRREKTLDALQDILALPKRPVRIEGYDISNIQGTNPVGAMVVFIHGAPQKDQYRKFKIISKSTPDDFAMMEEMLTRRMARVSKGKKESWPTPDLIVIDGGKGQLGIAQKVLAAYKLSIPVIGLAKRLEEIFVPEKKQSIRLPADSEALLLLEYIRDEAHRFARGYHTLRRSKTQKRSNLDDIPGIGPATKKRLLTKFGTVSAVQHASLDALAREIGLIKAKKVKQYL